MLCVSGGVSPIALFKALRVALIDWHCVTITLVDERYVDIDDPHSNGHLIRTHLLKDNAAAAKFAPIVQTRISPLPALSDLVNIANVELQHIEPADVLVLGMGADGHTASLFPQAANLAEALDHANTNNYIAIELTTVTPATLNLPLKRISQTLRQILTAQYIALPVSGADKLAVLEIALQGETLKYPVSYVLGKSKAPITIWEGV